MGRVRARGRGWMAWALGVAYAHEAGVKPPTSAHGFICDFEDNCIPRLEPGNEESEEAAADWGM